MLRKGHLRVAFSFPVGEAGTWLSPPALVAYNTRFIVDPWRLHGRCRHIMQQQVREKWHVYIWNFRKISSTSPPN